MASLNVRCIVPPTHIAGNLGWTLYYQDSRAIHELGVPLIPPQGIALSENTNSVSCELTASNPTSLVAQSSNINLSTAQLYIIPGSLTASNYKTVAVGNDLGRRGLITLEETGLWKPGTYNLIARLYDSRTKVPYREARRTWPLKDFTERLNFTTDTILDLS